MGRKEKTFSIILSIRKSATHMAEQFTFKECFGDGRTVDRNHGACGPSAMQMQGPCAEFFPGTAFTRDEHRYIRMGNACEQYKQLLHGLTFTD